MKNLIRALILVVTATFVSGCGQPAPTTPPLSAESGTLSPTRLAAASIIPPTLIIRPVTTATTLLTTGPTSTSTCAPTFGDTATPTYKPDAPVRNKVGEGHLLRGVVRSSQDCKPIVNARLELWPEAPGGGHPDEFRATIFSDRQGQYQFECNPTDHIHMRISAPGFQTIFTNAYHPAAGQREGNFEIVLLGVS